MLVWKFLNWKSCHKCGSLRTRVIVREEVGWGYDYDWIPFHGLCRIRHKMKTCACCGDIFLKQQSVDLILGKELNRYVEKMILKSIQELDTAINSEKQKA
jgi:serine protease inhibitor ecotin